MAWTWFQSHKGELWMIGSRDDEGGVIEERGIYRSTSGIDRTPTTVGTGLDGVSVGELLVREDR